MPRKKLGFTRDQHVELGKELATMRDRLVSISAELGNAYPPTIMNAAVKAQKGLDELRDKLDAIVFEENSGDSTKENASVYYPGRGRQVRA
ncbi:MAG TPA: hypothetical protein VM053_06770 [Gemmatimonadaceae bacterium]|nr:hypothetical protein [Gemmatimonadaceae bacterium]